MHFVVLIVLQINEDTMMIAFLPKFKSAHMTIQKSINTTK